MFFFRHLDFLKFIFRLLSEIYALLSHDLQIIWIFALSWLREGKEELRRQHLGKVEEHWQVGCDCLSSFVHFCSFVQHWCARKWQLFEFYRSAVSSNSLYAKHPRASLLAKSLKSIHDFAKERFYCLLLSRYNIEYIPKHIALEFTQGHRGFENLFL